LPSGSSIWIDDLGNPIPNSLHRRYSLSTHPIISILIYRPDQFLADVSSVLDVFDDPEDKLNAFNLLFNNVFDEHAAIKTVKIRGRPNRLVTCEIRDLMRSRDQWKKVAQNTNDPHAWSVYKNLCREVKHEIRTAEKTFIAEQVVNNKNNSNCL